ncbi:hypothetical protein [Sporosalibacterium faouarense]|uniref:hypothetical protein n=1 Tax=Sporosalibacterium faouarense TaxID=516123 RepID=UPI00141C906D|nr:hypothetical protein [Sporosalibacterium faouarense]MTI46716.1 hypothetical protein [Bacillota bacterium]
MDEKTGVKKRKSGLDMIFETYNSHKYPVINNQINAFVFPWNMQRDVDAIDSMRFYTETTENTVERGINGIPQTLESTGRTGQLE